MTSQPLNRPCGVDVLRVLDEVRSFSREWAGNDLALELDAARAAVAELIEADREFDAASLGYNPLFANHAQVDRYHLAVGRRVVALAAVEGQP